MTQLILDVLGLDASESVVRAVALALPIAVFCTLLVLLVVMAKRKAKRTRKHGAAAKAAPAKTAAAVPATVDQTNAARTVIPLLADGAALRRVEPSPQPPKTADASISPVAAPPAPEAEQPARPSSTPTTIEEQITAALAADQKIALAPLYLQLADVHRSAGRDGDCLNALRSAAGYGALHGPKAAHANARLELAEIALRNGDPIGACEQWQIARLAFHEDGEKDSYHRVDKRMRENGCPTDWVLTDF